MKNCFFEKKTFRKKIASISVSRSALSTEVLLISKSVKPLIVLGIVHLEVPLSSSGLEQKNPTRDSSSMLWGLF